MEVSVNSFYYYQPEPVVIRRNGEEGRVKPILHMELVQCLGKEGDKFSFVSREGRKILLNSLCRIFEMHDPFVSDVPRWTSPRRQY